MFEFVAVAGLVVVAEIAEVSGFASGAEGNAEAAAEVGPVDIAEAEAVGKAGAGIVVVFEHEAAAAAALGLVVSAYEQHYKVSSEAVAAAWDCAASFGAVFEPRVVFVAVAACEEEHTMAPCAYTQVLLPELQSGPTAGEPAQLGELDLFLDDMVEGRGVSAEVSKLLSVLETEPGSNPGGTSEAVLQPVDTAQTSGTRF